MRRIIFIITEFILGVVLVTLLFIAICDLTLRIQRNSHEPAPNIFGLVIAEVANSDLEPYVQQGEILIIQKENEASIGDIVAYISNAQSDVKRVEEIIYESGGNAVREYVLSNADGSGAIHIFPSELYGKKLASFGAFSGVVSFLQSTVGTSLILAFAIFVIFSPALFAKREKSSFD